MDKIYKALYLILSDEIFIFCKAHYSKIFYAVLQPNIIYNKVKYYSVY